MTSPLVVIAGPTASGKSALAMEMAQKYNGEIICADSRTIYRGMDIGTAKPTLADQEAVRHHVLDIVEPGSAFTAADFKKEALKATLDITHRGKLPIMVGGTGLYIDAVIFDYQFGGPADPVKRALLQEMSIATLQDLCLQEGVPLPQNSKNKRHLVRALEQGGLTSRELRIRPNTIVVALTTDRDKLRERIVKRTSQMVQRGVLEEIRRIGERYNWEGEALTSNIYRTLGPVVQGEISLEEGLAQVVTSDMRLAKRQITWLKRNPYIIWGEANQLKTAIEHFVQQNKLDQSIPAA
jgi:tRNA dimethylallyltransferase